MKQKLLFIFLLLIPSLVKTADKKTLSIVIAAKKTAHQHRFVLPLIAATECASTIYMLIPLLIASFGTTHLCLPAEPEMNTERINNLKLKYSSLIIPYKK